MGWRWSWWVLVLVAGAAAWGGEPVGESLREGPVVVDGRGDGLGERVGDLGFTDDQGRVRRLSEFRGRRAVVVCLTSGTCPVARKYVPTLAEIRGRFAGKGVEFVAVNVDEKPPADAGAVFRRNGWTGLFAVDRNGEVARGLGAKSTTEVFVIDRGRTLVYRGAVDDQFGLGYSLPTARENYLVRAIEAVLEDRPPAVRATTAPGCLLEVKGGAADVKVGATVTYHNRISRIVQANCLECHRAGENGPFELGTYAEVRANAAMIKKVVARRTMPPWFASAETAHPMKNNRSLTDRDREDLIRWVEEKCPEGDLGDGPVALRFERGWRIGRPDLVLEAPTPQKIPAKGTIRYRYVQIPTNLTEDRWVSAMEIRPSAPEVVHHLLVFIKLPANDPRAGQFKGMNGGLNGYFAGMVPGQGHIAFPEGTAKLLPKGATLVFQIHYTANGTEVEDRPRIGFKFAERAPEHEVLTRAASNRFFLIPPNAPNYEIKGSHMFFRPVRLLSVNPHSHVRGRAFRYELIYPDGRSEVILDVPRYDFNWQLEYQFARPIDVPAGTRLSVTGWYDNSRENPANPDASKAVGFGEQTWEEMMIGYFTGYVLK